RRMHMSHTKRASIRYVSPHSLHFSASTAIADSSCWSPRRFRGDGGLVSASPHLPGPTSGGLMELAPFSSPNRRFDGCRGFVGPCPSTPLDAYGYVLGQEDTDPPG